MKTKELDALAGTDAIVIIESAENSSDRFGRVIRTGARYITTTDDWSHRGVEIAVCDEEGNPVHVWPYGYEDGKQKTITVAPRCVVETKAQRDARIAADKAAREAQAEKTRQERIEDAKKRREPLADLLALVGPDMMQAIDQQAFRVENLRGLIESIKQATVHPVQPGVYNVDLVKESDFSYRGEKEVVSGQFLVLGTEVIDIDRGRRNQTVFSMDRETRLMAAAIMAHAPEFN